MTKLNVNIENLYMLTSISRSSRNRKQENLAPSNASLKPAFGPALICIAPLPVACRYRQICIHRDLFILKHHFSHHKFRLHLQLLLLKGFV